MSNRAWIIPTKFEEVIDGEITYGVRVFDEVRSGYIDGWDEMPATIPELFTRVCAEADDELGHLLTDAQDYQDGLYIGMKWYTWEQLEPTEATDDLNPQAQEH